MSKHEEHGTTRSYVIGFVLSLIFTIIPYHLVVNKVLAGNTLWVAIIGIAIIQMAIQLFFFLHLGRGPKPFYNVVFFFGSAGIIVITVGASIFIMNNLYRNMSPREIIQRLAQRENIAQIGNQETGACVQNLENHIVSIDTTGVEPVHISAVRCDTLTFMNDTGRTITLKFGDYPDEISYGGEYEVILDDTRPETITLNQTGSFGFYDELDPDIYGHIVVSQ